MPSVRRWLPAIALAVSPAALAAGDYVGLLRPPPALASSESGIYWPLSAPFGGGLGAATDPEPLKLKLGYRYSKYFSVETGYADFGPATLRAPFSSQPAWGRELRLDTVGTIPLWAHASLYGRVGAWKSDGGASLLAGGETNPRSGAGLRYGLGFKYDLTRRLGLQAEMERFSPLDRWGPRESDSDHLSVGVTWRF